MKADKLPGRKGRLSGRSQYTHIKVNASKLCGEKFDLQKLSRFQVQVQVQDNSGRGLTTSLGLVNCAVRKFGIFGIFSAQIYVSSHSRHSFPLINDIGAGLLEFPLPTDSCFSNTCLRKQHILIDEF